MRNGKSAIKNLVAVIFIITAIMAAFFVFFPNDLSNQIESSEVVVYSMGLKNLKEAEKRKINNESLFLDTHNPGKPCVIPKKIFSLFTYGLTNSVEPRAKDDGYPFPDWNSRVTSMVESDGKTIFIFQEIFIVKDSQGTLTKHRMKGKTLGDRIVYLADLYCPL